MKNLKWIPLSFSALLTLSSFAHADCAWLDHGQLQIIDLRGTLKTLDMGTFQLAQSAPKVTTDANNYLTHVQVEFRGLVDGTKPANVTFDSSLTNSIENSCILTIVIETPAATADAKPATVTYAYKNPYDNLTGQITVESGATVGPAHLILFDTANAPDSQNPDEMTKLHVSVKNASGYGTVADASAPANSVAVSAVTTGTTAPVQTNPVQTSVQTSDAQKNPVQTAPVKTPSTQTPAQTAPALTTPVVTTSAKPGNPVSGSPTANESTNATASAQELPAVEIVNLVEIYQNNCSACANMKKYVLQPLANHYRDQIKNKIVRITTRPYTDLSADEMKVLGLQAGVSAMPVIYISYGTDVTAREPKTTQLYTYQDGYTDPRMLIEIFGQRIEAARTIAPYEAQP
jgi:hypothetical protein